MLCAPQAWAGSRDDCRVAGDAGIAPGKPNPVELTLGHNVASQAEVDAVMGQAQRAGAVIVKPAQDTFRGGYAGCFQDPDGPLREVVWNPQFALED